MKTEHFKGALLSTLLIVSMIAPAISVISLLSVGTVSAPPAYENIVRGMDNGAYTQDTDAWPPWVVYNVGDQPPIMAAVTVGSGKVVIAGISSSCRDGRWNSGYMNENYRGNLSILLDKAFQWMKPGATKVLWYGETGIDYNVYNDAARCSELVENLENMGYNVVDTINGTFTSIYSALTSQNPDILVIPQMELGAASTGGDPTLLPNNEIENIYNFVAVQGKGLLIMEGNDTDGYNYERVQNKVLKRLDTGIYFQSDVVRDEGNYWSPGSGNFWQIYADVEDVDFGTTYRAATGKTIIGLYNCCSLAPKTDYEIAIGILPSYREGFPGGALVYTATISNAGWLPDSYTLSILDNIWPVTLSETTFSNVENGTSRTVTLTVNILSGASIGDNDQITFRVTGDSGKIKEEKFMAMAGNRIRPAWVDAGAEENDPNRNVGSEIWAQVASRENATMNWKDMRTWIKFNLRAIPEPVSIKPGNWSADNLQARLFIYCDYISGTAGENVRCYMVDNDTWLENEITWNNQPSLVPFADNYTTTKMTREDYWYSWDVTQLVRAKLKRSPRENFASFCLRAETEGAAYPDNFYYSFDMVNLKENRYHAYIVIGYDVDTWIDPTREEGMPCGTLKYRVNVWNRGSFADNFNLLVVENLWTTSLGTTTMSNVQPMEIRITTLSVKVPDSAVPCVDNDNIWVRATSTGYAFENDNDNCIAHASLRITPVEDTSARGRVDLENALYGGATSIYLGRYQSGPQRGWLKFDLNAIQTGMSIVRANLKLYCYDNIGMSAALRVYGVGDSWNEDNLNWFNQSTALGSPLDSVVVIENRRWYSFDVTSFVLNENAGDKVASFCVVDLGENVTPDHAALMESKEYTDNVSLWPYLEVLSAAPENEVRVYVNPTFQGDRAGRVDNYVITVKNKGTFGKTYNLTIENTQTWTWTLDSSSLWVSSGSENSTTLRVTIPSVAVCTMDNIKITATSALNSSENDVTKCYAHRGEVDFKLDNKEARPGVILGGLFTLKTDFKLYVRDNSGGLRMYFYGYDNVQENASLPPATVWSATPWNLDNTVMGPIYVQHVGGLVAVKRAALFLVDNAGNVISRVKGWVIIRDDLWNRLGGISTSWTFANSGERNALWKEIGDLSTQWSFAPTTRDPAWI